MRKILFLYFFCGAFISVFSQGTIVLGPYYNCIICDADFQKEIPDSSIAKVANKSVAKSIAIREDVDEERLTVMLFLQSYNKENFVLEYSFDSKSSFIDLIGKDEQNKFDGIKIGNVNNTFLASENGTQILLSDKGKNVGYGITGLLPTNVKTNYEQMIEMIINWKHPERRINKFNTFLKQTYTAISDSTASLNDIFNFLSKCTNCALDLKRDERIIACGKIDKIYNAFQRQCNNNDELLLSILYRRAMVNSKMDSDTNYERKLAAPSFEQMIQMIEKKGNRSSEDNKMLIRAYNYFMVYSFIKQQDKLKAKEWAQKILAIDSGNESATQIMSLK